MPCLFSTVLFQKVDHAGRVGQPQSQHVTVILMFLHVHQHTNPESSSHLTLPDLTLPDLT